MKQNRIVCAACRRVDGAVALGVRHFDKLMHVAFENYRAAAREVPSHPYAESWVRAEQGFIDKNGDFQSREQAWSIAKAAGQILYHPSTEEEEGTLFSENLY